MNMQSENRRQCEPGDAEETLRLIARLPAPEGLEDRVNARCSRKPAERSAKSAVAGGAGMTDALGRAVRRRRRLCLWWRAEAGACIRGCSRTVRVIAMPRVAGQGRVLERGCDAHAEDAEWCRR